MENPEVGECNVSKPRSEEVCYFYILIYILCDYGINILGKYLKEIRYKKRLQ